MKILHSYTHVPPELTQKGCVVTLGNFDGVHKGHQSLIARAQEKGAASGLPVVVITFSPHPLQVILGDKAPLMLMTLDGKLACLEELGVDATLVISFTLHFAALTPREFVEKILVAALNTKHLVIGYDYAFGKARQGDATALSSFGKDLGFNVEQVPALYERGYVISSTNIRNALIKGDVALAREFLGRPHFAEGLIVHGMNRGGKLLGFPTANMQECPDFLLPAEGVYAVFAEVFPNSQGEVHKMHTVPMLKGVASVGTNPTFADKFLRVETYLFDFSRDIYGSIIRVHFMERIRGQRTFTGVDELKEHIASDCATAKKLLERF